MTAYPVQAIREDGWWGLIADLGFRTVASQARRLDQAAPMIREAIALVLDVDEQSFDIDLQPRLDQDPDQLLARAHQLATDRARHTREHDRILAESAQLVDQLRTHTDLTMRDIATLIGVSAGRATQLANTQ